MSLSRATLVLFFAFVAFRFDNAAATPPFSIRQTNFQSWLIAPDGQPFFSLAVSVLTQGGERISYDPENPSYAAWQHYDSPIAWADATLRRLKAWHFTSIGGWADFKTLRQSSEQSLYLMPVLHIGSTAGAPWWDMWDPKNIARMEQIARDKILPLRDDPRVLGYYSDNELGWWNATLWKMTFEHAPSSGQRKRLIQLLRDSYKTWDDLLRDFEPQNAESWRQLERRGKLLLKPGGQGIHVMRRFLALMADRYYQLMRDTIRKYDTRALFLGDRYQSFYYPEVAQAAGRYVDAVSSNLNAQWNDGTFLRFYLDTLHGLTGKPILISEIYMAAMENRSRNRNNSGIYPVVTTQAERVEGLRTTLTHLARVPYVLGIEWFQFFDEPTHGRFDGENYNFGLVDIHDQPYAELTSVFQTLDLGALKNQPASPRADASRGIPPAPADPFADFVLTRALKHWDRERGFVKPASAAPLADLYLCWSSKAIYLGLYAIDMVEDGFYSEGPTPKVDRAQWSVQINQTTPVRARIGAGREPFVSHPDIRVEGISGVNLNVRSVALMELPAAHFGRDSFKSGDTIELDSTLLSHSQAYRTEWKGTFRLIE